MGIFYQNMEYLQAILLSVPVGFQGGGGGGGGVRLAITWNSLIVSK